MWLTYLVKARWVTIPIAILLVLGGAFVVLRQVTDLKGWLLIGIGVLQLVLAYYYGKEAKRVDRDDTIS